VRSSTKLKQYKISLLFLALFTLFFFFLGIIEPHKEGLNISLAGLIAIIFLTIDYKLIQQDLNLIEERHRFARDLIFQRKSAAFLLFVISIVIYLVQLLLVEVLGSLEIVMLKLGIVYGIVNEGEFWRLLIGFLFHSGFSHWLVNTFFLIGFAALARPYNSLQLFIFFMSGCITSSIGALILFSLGFSENDGFLGISGGTSALAGVVLMASIKSRAYFPKYFYISFLAFITSLTILDFITATNMTALSHLIGFSVGGLLSITVSKPRTLKDVSVNGSR